MSDPTHECQVINESDHGRLYNRSEVRWQRKRASDPTYNKSKHMAWVDQSNDGCSHFGFDPSLFPRSNIRFDIFHLKCGITKKLMSHLCKFILNQESSISDNFCNKVLKTFWNDFHIFIWKNKKSLSSVQGNEIALFVGNTSTIISFFNGTFIPTQEVKDIKEALNLWLLIFKFLGKTYLDDKEDFKEYKELMERFEENLRKFYVVGSRTFLSSPGSINGNEETFYCHCLRYYIPEIMRTTFNQHCLGVGIFNMQGFERRNKESKNCMNRFSNKKCNLTVNNVRRLDYVFNYGANAI